MVQERSLEEVTSTGAPYPKTWNDISAWYKARHLSSEYYAVSELVHISDTHRIERDLVSPVCE